MKSRRPLPQFNFETAWHSAGFRFIAGVDEAGRGALAGPLVAAAVVLPFDAIQNQRRLLGLNDSKVLSVKNRNRLFTELHSIAMSFGVGIVEPAEVDEYGLTAANRIAMERAVWALPIAADALLIDAFMIDSELPQHAIINGDALCLSIAAASVIAKVTRDRIMREAHDADPQYGFDRHKGYGSFAHVEALQRFGPCAIHRKSFSPVRKASR